uniref:Uncharacterized protein n=1 Tax=Panagrolaimus sp. PS1159 TaxID=55785 RepID=A0AC35F2F6_9BILA
MGIYKYLLVNISVWSYVLDFVLTLLWMPLPMMPAPSICITGILKNLGQYNGNGISFISFMFTFGGCNVSCFCAQLYRIYAATGKDTHIFSQRWFIAVMILCHCIASSPGIIGYFFTVELDNDSLIRYQITNFPFMKSVVWKLPCGGFIVDENHKNFLYFFLTVFVCVSIGIITNGIMLTYLLLSLKESFKNSVSLRNSQLQRQLVTVLIVQTLLPTICLCIPYSFVILSALTYSPFLSS